MTAAESARRFLAAPSPVETAAVDFARCRAQLVEHLALNAPDADVLAAYERVMLSALALTDNALTGKGRASTTPKRKRAA